MGSACCTVSSKLFCKFEGIGYVPSALMRWMLFRPLNYPLPEMDGSSTQFSKKYEIDCQYLHHLLSGVHATNPQSLVEIFASRSLQEIRLIRQRYSSLYNQDLIHLLSNSRRDNILYRLAYLRMREPHELDAEIIRDSLFGTRVDLNTLIEVVCTRNSAELQAVKQAYRSRYNLDIEQDVSLKASDSALVLRSSRNFGAKVDTSMAMCDAKTLYEAMESGKYVDQRTITSLMSQRSTAQLNSVLVAYKQLYGHDLSKSLKRNKCGEFGKDLSIAIKCLQYPEKYFSKKLRKATNNFDSREALIRIIATRSDSDIKSINNAFVAKTGSSLDNLVRREFSATRSRNSDGADKINKLVAEILVGILKCY
ncbi:hypothetical protein Sjap_018721 [Stephania japonica]|uniref:Annexin n=1 Tax=Stephania japonica TaxID=461633 RepID=A0AAP0I8G0_9MAGN